jgi:hypothetical protein
MTTINSVLVRFPEFSFGHHKINQFRGEVIEMNEDDENDLFHNHTENGGMITRYPRIQYRVSRNPDTGRDSACIWALDDGVIALKNFLFSLDNIGYQTEPAKTEIGISNELNRYQIKHFLPFNVINWQVYKKNQNILQCKAQLEKIIVGNILNFCKEFGYEVPNKSLEVEIIDFKELGMKHCPTQKKGNLYLMAFDVIYEANIVLPPSMGLGRFKAKGYGWQTPTQKTKLRTMMNNRRNTTPRVVESIA